MAFILCFCPVTDLAPRDEASSKFHPKESSSLNYRELVTPFNRQNGSSYASSIAGLLPTAELCASDSTADPVRNITDRRLRQIDIRCPPWISPRDSLVSTGPAATRRHQLSRTLRAILCPLRRRWRQTSVSHPAKLAKIHSIWRPRRFSSLEWFPIWIHWVPLPALPLEGPQPRISQRSSFRLHSSRKSILHSRPSTPLNRHRQM